MLKYRGQYRVIYECDKRTGKPGEFTFIPCRKGNICRHNENTLNAYISSIKSVNKILEQYPDIFTPYQIGDREATLLFPESKIEQAAIILKAITKGKNVSPRSKTRNARYI